MLLVNGVKPRQAGSTPRNVVYQKWKMVCAIYPINNKLLTKHKGVTLWNLPTAGRLTDEMIEQLKADLKKCQDLRRYTWQRRSDKKAHQRYF
jgi:hypothetical protein